MVKQIFSAKSNKLTRAFRGKQVQIGYMKNIPFRNYVSIPLGMICP